MATFNSPPEFINSNVTLLSQRQSSMYSIFLESKPTYTTYFHVNKIRSRTDKGLKMPERLNGVLSPIRYNKIINFPLYGIEQIQLQLEEEEEGLTSDYNGEAIILPNTIHPTVDDYFLINYLEKPYMFRVVKYDYDTIKSNSYYKIEFELKSVDIDFYNDIEKQVVKTYYTQLENIGTEDNVFLTEEESLLKDGIKGLYNDLVVDYLNKYYYPHAHPYNTLLFHQESEIYWSDWDLIFDQNLVHFCNENKLFYEHDSTQAIYFYEEPRPYFLMDYSKSIYDLVEHYEAASRFDKINKFFCLEPTAVMYSIFMYYRDKRVRYLHADPGDKTFFGHPTQEYIPPDFVTATTSGDISELTNPIDKFISQWLIDQTDHDSLLEIMKDIENHHNEYSFHNFIFIPLLLYCLSNLYNSLGSGEDSISDELGNEIGCENI